ncbi:MAG: homoserine kinase [Synergistales bacterium]
MNRPLLSLRLPATSANLGSGFDTMGLALSLYNDVEVLETLEDHRYEIEVIGEGSPDLAQPSANLLIKSYEYACRKWGQPTQGLRLRSINAIPLGRGLGSSATAVVGGILIANAFRGKILDTEALLTLATELEGHPDNAVPCLVGGMVVSCWNGSEVRYVRLPAMPVGMSAVVAVPDFKVLTHDARDALPREVSLGEAVFNLSRAALFAASWATGNWENLMFAMEDRLHQQFRARLFPGGEAILARMKKIPECLGVAISGSGPSMLAFSRGNPQRVAIAMCQAFSESGVRSRFFVLDTDMQGARARGVTK